MIITGEYLWLTTTRLALLWWLRNNVLSLLICVIDDVVGMLSSTRLLLFSHQWHIDPLFSFLLPSRHRLLRVIVVGCRTSALRLHCRDLTINVVWDKDLWLLIYD